MRLSSSIRSTKRADIPPEWTVKTATPKIYAFLYQLQEFALKREKYWRYFAKQQRFDAPLPLGQQGKDQKYFRLRRHLPNGTVLYDVSDAPFYTLFNVGPYSFTPFKVVWQMGASRMKAAVISTYVFSVGGKSMPPKLIIPCTGTTSYASFQGEEEAHYVCALMNSSLVGALLKSFSAAGRGFGAPPILNNIAIPKFNPKDKTHQALSWLSKRAHGLAATGKTEELEKVEAEVDKTAANLWSVTDDGLKTIGKL